MYRKEFVERMSDHAGLGFKETDRALRAFTEAVTEALYEGDRVVLMGFGTFSVHHYTQRIGHNPQTGEPMVIPPRNIPRFRPGKRFREAIERQRLPGRSKIVFLAAAALALAVVAVALFMPGRSLKQTDVAIIQPGVSVLAIPVPEVRDAVSAETVMTEEETATVEPMMDEVEENAPEIVSIAEIVASLPVMDEAQFTSYVGGADRYYVVVNFDYDADHLNPRPMELLYSALADLGGHLDDVREIRIEGHTDTKGPNPYNIDLSRRRAMDVAEVVSAEIASDDVDLHVGWEGETEPVAPNDTSAGRARNRRVEIMFRFERPALAHLD